MSEELLQTIPLPIGRYTYYRLGQTTVDQLKQHQLIPNRNYGPHATKRPDGLLRSPNAVCAVIEYKTPDELKTERQIQIAIDQEIEVAKALCNLLIVTDGSKSYWINPHRKEPITDHDGNPIRTVFHPAQLTNTPDLEHLFTAIHASVTPSNSRLSHPMMIDPTPIATRLWQTIWVATGKSPVKCLYNVVELFIFKFLSDLQVLPDDLAFPYIYNKANDDPREALEFYARNSRPRIYRLFPPGLDGTTIINGTIFVSETNEPNLSQSILFARCLRHLQDYTEQFGSLTQIDKRFKTNLYESFLKQEVEALGQYFTPRRIVQSIIRMAGLNEPNYPYREKRICDPFCGVGGFPLEILNMNDGMMKCYDPAQSGTISLPFTLHGFDKGFERDDERTIILAKANMLIYLAELLFANPLSTKAFATVFNDTFTLFKDNLGTFGHIIDDEADKYDLILTNPPYVTSGSSIIKEEIRDNPATIAAYPVSGLGLESLSIEWIIRSLKPGGRGFIVIPDGILSRVNGNRLRQHILDECFLDAIISLPRRTFFANFKETYILAITKKNQPADVQTTDVFAYLVSNIGEKLSSVKREEMDANDLPEMESLFRQFLASPGAGSAVASQSARCKVFPYSRFVGEPHWVVNRWWSASELALVGNGDQSAFQDVSAGEINQLLAELQAVATDYDEAVAPAEFSSGETVSVELGNEGLFRTFIGKRQYKANVQSGTGTIPVFSANVFEEFGRVETSNVSDFAHPALL